MGYTLAEIIVVMLIIAVVVAVTIGITKAKLDNIVSYTYYSAYSTLRSISTEILADWDPQDPEYKQALQKNEFLYTAYIKNNILGIYRDLWSQPAFANCARLTADGTQYEWGCTSRGGQWCSSSSHIEGSGCFTCCTPISGNTCNKTCGSGYILIEPICQCVKQSGGGSSCTKTCSSGFTLDKSSCTCKCTRSCGSGYKLNSLGCFCEKLPCTNKPSTIPCGQSWDESSCSLSGSVKTCGAGYSLDGNCNCVCTRTCGSGYTLDSKNCSCVKDKVSCWDGSTADSTSDCPPKVSCWDGSYATSASDCPSKVTCWDGSVVHNESECNSYVTCWDGSKASSQSDCPSCTNVPSSIPCGQSWNSTSCRLEGTAKSCPSGSHLNSSCNCVSDCPSNLACDERCDYETGLSTIPGYSRSCSDETFEWSEEQCKCIPSPRTLPRKGMNFCKLFERHANIMSGSDVCSGSVISNGTTDFSNKSPDITLRNGLRVYNMHSDAGAISMLSNNTQGGVYDGVPNTNSYGYTVYVDIDGSKGDSQLWSDVYPFYITLSGKIIPAYDTSNANSSGGDSVRHLQVSVENENYTSGKRSTKWLAKSVPFKEGACISGYVGDATPYCKNGTSYTQASECTSNINSICRVKQIQPVKFFF